MNKVTEQREKERKNEVLKSELIRAVQIIVNPANIRIYTVGNNNCHLQTDVRQEFNIMQGQLTEVISKIISNNK